MPSRFARNLAAIAFLIAVSTGLTFVRPAQSDEIVIQGADLAREMNAMFADTQLTIGGYSDTLSFTPEGGPTFRVAGRSRLQFGRPLLRYGFALDFPEVGYSYSSARSGTDSWVLGNMNDVRTASTQVVAVPGGFNLVFTMERDGPEMKIGCTSRLAAGETCRQATYARRREDGAWRSYCPCSVDPVYAPPPQEVQWNAPLVFVRITPEVLNGSLTLRVRDVGFAGIMRLTQPIRDFPGRACSYGDIGTICGMVGRYLGNLDVSRGDRTAIGEQLDTIFESRNVRTIMAFNLYFALRRLGVTGVVTGARMQGRDMVVTYR